MDPRAHEIWDDDTRLSNSIDLDDLKPGIMQHHHSQATGSSVVFSVTIYGFTCFLLDYGGFLLLRAINLLSIQSLGGAWLLYKMVLVTL